MSPMVCPVGGCGVVKHDPVEMEMHLSNHDRMFPLESDLWQKFFRWARDVRLAVEAAETSKHPQRTPEQERLRDEMATAAMQSLLPLAMMKNLQVSMQMGSQVTDEGEARTTGRSTMQGGEANYDEVAFEAYQCADAMLRARERKDGQLQMQVEPDHDSAQANLDLGEKS